MVLHKLLQLPFRICYDLRTRPKGRGATKKKSWWQRTRFYSHFVHKRPWYIATLLPLLLVWAVWFPCIGGLNQWHLYTDRYFLVVAMLFASLVAGFLSQGTGGLSFPVMTLLFAITPLVARDFALLTQAVVLSGASFAIIYQNIPLETNAILFSSVGGAFGLVFALQWIAPLVHDTEAIMNFVSLWIGFGAAVFWLRRESDKETHLEIPNCSNWKAFVLMVTGFCGGMLTAMFGTGLDLSVFSCLALFFRIHVNTAAPTGVVIQMINSLVAVAFKLLFMGGFQQAAVLDWVAALPFVSLGAPLGTVCLSFVNRTWVSGVIYLVALAQFVYAIATLTINTDIIFFVVVIIVTTTGLFLLLAKLGEKLVDVENKGYIFNSDDDEDDNDDVYGATPMSSCESLPSMEELRAGKKKMERREISSDGVDYYDDDEEEGLLQDANRDIGRLASSGWSPYGRKSSLYPSSKNTNAATAATATATAAERAHLLGSTSTGNPPQSYM